MLTQDFIGIAVLVGLCCCSVAQSCLTFWNPWTAVCQASLSFSITQSLFKLMSIESEMSSNHLILCHPLLLLPSIFLCIGVFSNRSAPHIRWSKYWSFSFHISPPNEYDWAPCRPRDSQESSPKPHFKSINSLVLSLLYGPTLTSIYDYWKNHSFD